jgi:ketosteroid isomerase-like protein
MKATFSLLVLSAAAAVACQPAPPQFTAADEASVKALFDSTVQWIRRNDMASWSNEFADDAVFYAPNGKAIHGRAAILAWGKANPKMEQFGFSDVRVSGDGNSAWGTSAVSMKVAGAPADTAKQLVVFKRSAAGAWQVVAVAFNTDLPMPAAAAPSKAAPAKSKAAPTKSAPAKAPQKKGR